MIIEVGKKYLAIDKRYGIEEGDEVEVISYSNQSVLFLHPNNSVQYNWSRSIFERYFDPIVEEKTKQNNIVKSPTISQSDLAFLQEATKQLHLNPEWYTYRNDENSYIALRMENSINIFRIEPVANFEGVLSQ